MGARRCEIYYLQKKLISKKCKYKMYYLNHFLRCFVALDDRCQSVGEKITFGKKISHDIANVDWPKIDIRTHVFRYDISQRPKSLLHSVRLYNKSICCVLLITKVHENCFIQISSSCFSIRRPWRRNKVSLIMLSYVISISNYGVGTHDS